MPGGEALQDFLPHGLLTDPFDEILDNFEIHVRFKKREADLLQGLGNILLREHTLPPEFPQNFLELVAQRIKHRTTKKEAIEASRQISDRLEKSRKRASVSL